MTLELTNPMTVIGRDEGDIATLDPETSRRHAMIEIMDDGSAWLSDLGSRNGTFTNDSVVSERTQLTDRQEFTCGKSTFMVKIT
jgi:pSer/pThr/pTyr-binding forkhead associated (FHA) protein